MAEPQQTERHTPLEDDKNRDFLYLPWVEWCNIIASWGICYEAVDVKFERKRYFLHRFSACGTLATNNFCVETCGIPRQSVGFRGATEEATQTTGWCTHHFWVSAQAKLPSECHCFRPMINIDDGKVDCISKACPFHGDQESKGETGICFTRRVWTHSSNFVEMCVARTWKIIIRSYHSVALANTMHLW